MSNETEEAQHALAAAMKVHTCQEENKQRNINIASWSLVGLNIKDVSLSCIHRWTCHGVSFACNTFSSVQTTWIVAQTLHTRRTQSYWKQKKPMMVDDGDMSMAKVRLKEVILFAEHVQKISNLKMDTRN